MQLHKTFGDDVACMTLSLDYTGGEDETPESLRDRVHGVLAERNISVTNFLCSDPSGEVFERIAPLPIPLVMVYDRAGNLRKQFHNGDEEYGKEGFTYEQHIIPFVAELLKEDPQ